MIDIAAQFWLLPVSRSFDVARQKSRGAIPFRGIGPASKTPVAFATGVFSNPGERRFDQYPQTLTVRRR
jgi:hypothetical protein